MPKYICRNQECSNFNNEITISKSITKFVNGKLVDSASACPKCKKEMEFQRPGTGFTTFMNGIDDVKR
jgi:hypothetical protein